MSDADRFGQVMKARYAFAGAQAELETAVPLAVNESILVNGVMRLRGVGVLPRPAVVRLSTERLAVLVHYAFRSDTVWDLPRAAVRQVDLIDDTVRLAWCSSVDVDELLQLIRWTGRPALGQPIRDVNYVADKLQSWLTPGHDTGGTSRP